MGPTGCGFANGQQEPGNVPTSDGMPMTRVLWLTPDKPKDISVGRRQLADHLERNGMEVTLRGTSRQTAWQSLHERDEYDAVVGTTRAGALVGAALRLIGGPPLVVDHVDPIRQFEETAPRLLALAVKALEACSFRIADHVLYVYGEEHGRVARHGSAHTRTALGVDVERFADPAPEAVEAARERLPEDVGDRIAVYVGGLEPIYHVEELLAAADSLDDWSLVIAGVGSLEPAVDRAADYGNIVYLGTLGHETVPGLLALADVGVSLVDDPHTLKVLEYGAAGLPVVQLRGRAEAWFGDRVVYSDADPDHIADAIERAAGRDGQALRAFVEQFDWAEIAETYRETVELVVEGQ